MGLCPWELGTSSGVLGPLPNVLLCTYLLFQRKSWKRRFFALDDFTISYFKCEQVCSCPGPSERSWREEEHEQPGGVVCSGMGHTQTRRGPSLSYLHPSFVLTITVMSQWPELSPSFHEVSCSVVGATEHLPRFFYLSMNLRPCLVCSLVFSQASLLREACPVRQRVWAMALRGQPRLPLSSAFPGPRTTAHYISQGCSQDP